MWRVPLTAWFGEGKRANGERKGTKNDQYLTNTIFKQTSVVDSPQRQLVRSVSGSAEETSIVQTIKSSFWKSEERPRIMSARAARICDSTSARFTRGGKRRERTRLGPVLLRREHNVGRAHLLRVRDLVLLVSEDGDLGAHSDTKEDGKVA